MENFIFLLAQSSTTMTPQEEQAAASIIAAIMAMWAAMGIGMLIFWIIMMLLVVAMVVFKIFLQWKILQKAGYSPWLALLHLIPIGALVMNIILAFSEWPLEKEAGKKK